MTDRNEATERILLVIIPLSLIFIFGRRLFFPEVDAEWPSPTVNFLTIASELGMLIGVVGLTLRRLKSPPRPGAAAGPWMVLPVLGALAGVGLFVIRMSGGREGGLLPRSTSSAAEQSNDSEAPADLREFGARLEAAAGAYSKAETALSATSWAKATREDRRKLSRKELQNFLAREQELNAAIDKVIDLLKEPGFDVRLARLVSFAAAQGGAVPSADVKQAGWLALRRAWAANQKIWTIVDAHWDEWRANPEPAAGKQEPWQKEMVELEREGDLAQKEHDALTAEAEAPPIEAPILVQGGGRLAAVVHDIRRQFGPGRVLKEITITRDGVGIVVRDAQNPARTVSHSRNYKSLAKEEDFPSSTGSLFSGGEVRETELFGVDEADWTRVPAVARAGLEKIPIPGGRVSEVALIRRIHPLEEYPPDWKVHVTGGGLIGGESGNAFFDAKGGELTDIELPKSLIKPAAYLEPENTRRLLTTILEDFPPATRFIELTIDDERALLTATRPKHPNDLRRYGYTATERAKLGKHPPIPVDDPKARGGIFTAAEVAAFVPRIDALRTSAFKTLGMKDGKVQSMAFWRKHMVHSSSKSLLLEFRCKGPTGGSGSVVYELSGKEFYVAMP